MTSASGRGRYPRYFYDLSLADHRRGVRFKPALRDFGDNIAASAHHQFMEFFAGCLEVKARRGKPRRAFRQAIARNTCRLVSY